MGIKLSRLFALVALLTCFSVSAQVNVVPNGSFETYTACPTTWGRIPDATPWQLVTGASGTPDYFNGCSGATWGVPVNTYGNQAAATGVGYIGMIGVYTNSASNFREYAQVQLDSTLVAGECYHVSFKWSLAESGQVALDCMGGYLSATPPTGAGWGNIAVTPTWRNAAGNFMTDKTGWNVVSDTITAVGTERWLTLGNFYGTTTPTVPVTGGSRSYSIYYIDDVVIHHVSCSTPMVTTENDTICQGDSVAIVGRNGGSAYQWYVAGNPGVIISNDDTAWVSPTTTTRYVVSSGGATDTSEVYVIPISADAGNDRTICAGDNTTLGGAPTGPAGSSFVWTPSLALNNANIANPNASPAASQQYVVTVTNGVCVRTDTVNVNVITTTPTTSTVTICQGQSALIHGVNQTVAGTYIDTIPVNGCDSISSVTLVVNNGSNTTVNPSICQGQTYWAGGAAQSTSGTYTDSLTSASGCDSVITTNLTVLPVSSSSSTVNICQGQSVVIHGITRSTAGVYVDTLANYAGCDSISTVTLVVNPVYADTLNFTLCDGDSIQVNGTYYSSAQTLTVNFASAQGCDSSITYVIEEILRPVVDLGPDIEECDGNVVSLAINEMPAGFESVWWNGSQAPVQVVTKSGNYWITVTHPLCYVITDTVAVNFKDCNFYFYVPNAFTPNGDNNNPTFRAKAYGELVEFEMLIFDRWGELLFSADDIAKGWDGTYQGNPAKTDTYVWKINYKSRYEEAKSVIGKVTLLR